MKEEPSRVQKVYCDTYGLQTADVSNQFYLMALLLP
jgi:hypothetical protein